MRNNFKFSICYILNTLSSGGRNMLVFSFVLLHIIIYVTAAKEDEPKSVEEEKYGVKYAGNCEVCKYLVIELESKLLETGKTHEVIEIGYDLDPAARKKKKYSQSELRLVESLEGICDRILSYNIHKERKDSTRFAKGMSTTFKVLHDLVDKGVKVELGIPEELWDKPSAEITNMKSQCENMLEKHESDIEDWYFNHQDKPLMNFLCVEKALRNGDNGCIYEEPTGVEDKSEEKKKKKGDDSQKLKTKKSKKKKQKEEL